MPAASVSLTLHLACPIKKSYSCLYDFRYSVLEQQSILGQYCFPVQLITNFRKLLFPCWCGLCAVGGCVQCSSVSTEEASALPVASWLVSGEADLCPDGVFAVTIVFCTHQKKNSEIYITFLNCCHNLGIIAFRHYLWQKLNSLSSRAVWFLSYVWLTLLFEDQTSATDMIALIKHKN